MSKKTSAGILLYRMTENGLEVFLVHPGGPYWQKKDEGAWSVPKGEFEAGEDSLEAAKREFKEETGFDITGDFIELSPLKQPSGKVVYAWAVEGNIDAKSIRSNMFSMEWPPRSGREQEFPEVDKGGWFTIAQAQNKLLPGQRGFLAQLKKIIVDS
ncbi:MAG: NUDIX domain-containing protein [Syntrophaceae bacterium]|nr:NUDIX domain-containing protein [Syntrophaceae bacterium]